MATFLINLMTSLLLFQAVSGWCCHHPCQKLEECSADIHGDCCHRAGESIPEIPADTPCECDDCLGFCTYVAERPAELETSELISTVITLAAFLDCHQDVERTPTDGQYRSRGFAPAPPLRLHLLHQLLLV